MSRRQWVEAFWHEIHHLDLRQQRLNNLFERFVCRVYVKVIVAVILVFEFENEDMGYSILNSFSRW